MCPLTHLVLVEPWCSPSHPDSSKHLLSYQIISSPFFCNFDSFSSSLFRYIISGFRYLHNISIHVCCLPFLSNEPELDVDELFVFAVATLPETRIFFCYPHLSLFFPQSSQSQSHLLCDPPSLLWAIWESSSALSFANGCVGKNEAIHSIFFLPSTSLLCCERR